ncbi:hypothetical protein ACC870_38725, partial [Rhizobium ruizarguesonis]
MSDLDNAPIGQDDVLAGRRTTYILGLPQGAIRKGMNIDGLPGTAECRAVASRRAMAGGQTTSQFALS